MSENQVRYAEKPEAGHGKLRREDRLARDRARCLARVNELLRPSEQAGMPFRQDGFVKVPIRAVGEDAAASAERQENLRTLVAAWLDDPPED